ncbi:hypothetical protein LINPERHAP2_LOCUS4611 [Linum perenne]
MVDCSRTNLNFDENVRSSWICGKEDQNEKENQGPQLQLLPVVPPQLARGCGGLPPSVAARLSSNLHRQWAHDRQDGMGGRGGRRSFHALPGPSPHLNIGPGRPPRGSGPSGPRPHNVRPLRIMAPGHNTLAGPHVELVLSQLGSSCKPHHQQLSNDGRGQLLSAQMQPATSKGLIVPVRAASTPLQISKPAASAMGRRSAPLPNAASTPQSKLVIGPAHRSALCSSSSTGSGKRKLMSAFENADGLPHHCMLGRPPFSSQPSLLVDTLSPIGLF